ncbi:MAG TPA: hypothetical protein VFS25_08325 [Chitinophaga sp.]|uniref:hypothetical protein n=1 Tax=Chitinophaga sp. TaxID=1869181 RepID=UPI002DC02FF7|nr:hypothetical protein [Chitinophaga sp.]HEU4552825.1 hypothetical protein [Chitinophaga sp.]
MKMNRILFLLAGVSLLFSCSKKDDVENQPAGQALPGKWTMITQYRTYNQSGAIQKDTVNYAAESNYWTFDATAGKIYQLKNAFPDTVAYKLIENDTKIVTSVDEQFIFQLDTLTIQTLTDHQLKLSGHYTAPYSTDVIYNFGK